MRTIVKKTRIEIACDFQVKQPERTDNDRCFHTNKGVSGIRETGQLKNIQLHLK